MATGSCLLRTSETSKVRGPRGHCKRCRPDAPCEQARESVRNSIVAEQRQAKRVIPQGVGAYSKKVDAALPGRHTRTLYDDLKREEARMLAQLRTGMARVNGYLCLIGAIESEKCQCGKDRETVEHFLFECPQWKEGEKIC